MSAESERNAVYFANKILSDAGIPTVSDRSLLTLPTRVLILVRERDMFREELERARTAPENVFGEHS